MAEATLEINLFLLAYKEKFEIILIEFNANLITMSKCTAVVKNKAFMCVLQVFFDCA